jgi:hypothetical protein
VVHVGEEQQHQRQLEVEHLSKTEGPVERVEEVAT